MENKFEKKIIISFFIVFIVFSCNEKTIYQKWNSKISKRYQVVDSIIKDKTMYLKNKEEIISLLGKPQSVYNDGNIFSYYCGMSIYMGISFKDSIVEDIWRYENFFKDKFSKSKWENEEYRFEVVDDLISNYLKIGCTEDFIVSLLGLPDKKYNNCLYYNIGIGYSGNLMDPDWLMLCFENQYLHKIEIIVY
ncbi:MAG: hypothetical protein JXR63_09440 [Spirochaetales bacterium]|nr:hypothetical protein [Spirochaetales bacterium]